MSNNRKIIEWNLCETYTMEELSRLVCVYLDDGWELYGDVLITPYRYAGNDCPIWRGQIMVKYGDKN